MLTDISKSRLSSISQQSNQLQGPAKTSQALLSVYYQLYAIDYVGLPPEPKKSIKLLSQTIEQKFPSSMNQALLFKQSTINAKSQRYLKYMKQIGQKQANMSNSRFLSPEQLNQRIKQKLFESQNKTAATQTMQQSVYNKQSKMKYSFNSQLDQTGESNLSIFDTLAKLNQLDQQRTQIKFQIYSEDNSKLDALYIKWANLHQKMKQILEIYINKIGNGKSILELYNDFENLKNSKKMLEGYTQKELLLKLDIYLQSLFLDQREILLYRNSSEKSRSITNKGVRKMLIYN